MPAESPASKASVSALYSTLQDLSCEVTNTRLSIEQDIFALQDQNRALQLSVDQLQRTLTDVEHTAREASYQVAVARLEVQQLQLRLETAIQRVSTCEEALDLHSLD